MALDLLGNLQRTHMCGELRLSADGEQVVVMGWVNRRRDHGNLIFLDLRDRAGIVQIVLDKELCPEAHAKAEAVRPEYVVAVQGKVRRRDAASINPNMPTGEIEIDVDELRILNDAKTPPFSPAEEAIGNEELRLEISLYRSAPAGHAGEHDPAAQGCAGDSAVSFGRRIFRD